MASQLTTTTGIEHKCGCGRCPIRHSTALTQCFVTGCDKMVHSSCFNFLCLTKNSLNHFSDKHPEAVVCGKRHYDAAVKMINQSSIPIQNQNIAWNRDGKKGPDDQRNSEYFIVMFMTDERMVQRCRNGEGGKNKEFWHLHLQNQMKQAGIIKLRSTKEIRNKIMSYEDKFKSTHDFANSETGAGILEKDGATSFNDLLNKKFKHYFDFIPTYGCRASAKPILTTDDVEEEEEEIGEKESDGADDVENDDSSKFSCSDFSFLSKDAKKKMNKDDDDLSVSNDSEDGVVIMENEVKDQNRKKSLTDGALESSKIELFTAPATPKKTPAPSPQSRKFAPSPSECKNGDIKRKTPSLTDNFTTPRKKGGRKGKDAEVESSFENSILEFQRNRLKFEERKFEHSSKRDDIDLKVKIMREVKQLQKENFTKEEILAMMPEAKPMFKDD